MNNELRDVLKAQRWRRRRNFWTGFAVLALFGGLWAQLSKDPIDPNFDQGFINDFPAEPAFEEVEADFAPVPLTTAPPPQTATTVAATGTITTVAP